jgi:hypothetical protein
MEPLERRLLLSGDVWQQLTGWERLTGPWGSDYDGTFGAIAIDPANPAVCLIASGKMGGGVFKTTDGGASWTPQNTGIDKIGLWPFPQQYPSITKIAFAPSDPNVLYLTTAVDDSMNPLGDGHVYRSGDGGSSWQRMDGTTNWLGVPQVQDSIYSLAISPTDPNTVLIGATGQGVLKTTDGGSHWSIIYAAAPASEVDYFNAVSFAPHDSSILYISGVGSFSGGIWFPTYADPRNMIDFSGVLPLGPFKSVDGGATWQTLSLPRVQAGFEPLVTDIACDPVSGDLYAATSTYQTPLFYGVNNAGILESQNGGTTWATTNASVIGDLSKYQILNLARQSCPGFRDQVIASAGSLSATVLSNINGNGYWDAFPPLPGAPCIGAIGVAGSRVFALTSAGVFAVDGSVPSPSAPTVGSFVVPTAPVTQGSAVQVQWTVSDVGGPGLKQVELWRAPDVNGHPGTWVEIGSPTSLSGNGPTSGSFSDVAGSGTWWYGIHVVDVDGVCTTEHDAGLGPRSVVVTPAYLTPCISSVSPAQPLATNGQQNFTVYGSNFDSTAYVNLMDNGGTVHLLSGSRIISHDGAHITVNPNFTTNGVGTWQVQVVNGNGASSPWLAFSVVAATAPSISSVSPAQPLATNGQQNFTVYGSNFDSTAYVNLMDNGGTVHLLSGSRIISHDGTHITANPNFTTNGVGTWQVQVVNGSGASSPWMPFQVIAVPVGDTTPPTISAFTISSTTNTVGTPVTIWYTASDAGGSGLETAQLWRAPDNGYGQPGTWQQVGSSVDISAGGNGPFYGSFSNAPPVGRWWFSVRVYDGASPSNWNDEKNSQSGGVPGSYGPCQVTVTAVNQPPTIASLGASPNPVTQGDNVTLTAGGVNDGDGTVTGVSFYLESNGQTGLQFGPAGDTFLGSGSKNASDWSWSGSTTSCGLGTNNFYVIGWDDDGALSNVLSTTATVIGMPEIAVEGHWESSVENISNGKPNPGWGDGTYFGTVIQGATPPTRTYTVHNTGTAPLVVGTPSLPPGFTLVSSFVSPIQAGGSSDFTVQMSTSTIGTVSGNISFSNSDADGGDGVENPFSFAISGTVTYSGAAATTTVLTVSPSSLVYGQTATLSARVAVIPPGSGTPNGGSVTFMAGTTVLGSVPVSNGSATLTTTSLPAGLDSVIALYSGDGSTYASSTIGTNLIISTVAGNGYGYAGDGGQATAALLAHPNGIAVDSSGNLFIADTSNGVVREVNHATGVISTVAGIYGAIGYNGDNMPATAAQLGCPYGVAVDNAGHLFIADGPNFRVREVNLLTGIITTVAGNGNDSPPYYNGDNIQATAASLCVPKGVAVDNAGHLFIADTQNNRIREVDLSSGIITTVAGGGTGGLGDNDLATSATLSGPTAIAVDVSGNLFIADTWNARVREVNHLTHVITTIAGNGTAGFSGDGGQAVLASLNAPWGVTVDSAGNVFIADSYNGRIREVSAGTISTFAGGSYTFGDGGPAVSASVSYPCELALDAAHNLFVADSGWSRIREIKAGNLSASVTPAVLTVAADDKSRMCGAENPPFTATLSGFQNGESLATSGLTGSPALSSAATSSSPVGEYAIVAGAGTLAAQNYSFAFADGVLTVAAQVDTTAPTVTVGALVTRDAKPTLTGTVVDAAPGSGIAGVSVTVGAQILSATVNANTWSVAVPNALLDGVYDIQARATDNAGNCGYDTTTNELTIDTLPPTITVAAMVTTNGAPTLTGTVNDASPSSGVGTVSVVVGTQTLVASVDHGTWNVAVPVALLDGVYDVQATAIDNAGNTGKDSTTDELTIDMIPPVIMAVKLNGKDGQTVSSIEPSGIGIQIIEITFSEPVAFAGGAVQLHAVTFPGGVETVGSALTPTSVTGTGTNKITITFDSASVVDTWVKVELNSAGITDLAGDALDGEAKLTGNGRGYIFDAAADLPTGDGTAGGDASFYVGSLRGDFRGVGFIGSPPADGQLTPEDVDAFLAAYQANDLDADFRGQGFIGAPPPDGQITPEDFDAFLAVYQAGKSLDALPLTVGGSSAPANTVVQDVGAAPLSANGASGTANADAGSAPLPSADSAALLPLADVRSTQPLPVAPPNPSLITMAAPGSASPPPTLVLPVAGLTGPVLPATLSASAEAKRVPAPLPTTPFTGIWAPPLLQMGGNQPRRFAQSVPLPPAKATANVGALARAGHQSAASRQSATTAGRAARVAAHPGKRMRPHGFGLGVADDMIDVLMAVPGASLDSD